MEVRPVAAEQWPVLEWRWQSCRRDLSEYVDAYPRADGLPADVWILGG